MEENKFYVYEWFIKNTGEVFYVGKGCNNRAKEVNSRNKFFKDMYASHDCDYRIIADKLCEKDAFQKEIETIKYYKDNTDYRLTNQTDGGEGCSGWVPSQETRDKQKILSKKRWEDRSFYKRMVSIRRDDNGPYKSQEFRDKISSIVKGENNPNYHHYWSDEMKNNLREKQIKNPRYKDNNNPNAKSIICLETGEVFSCIKYALEQYSINDEASVSIALTEPNRTAGGKHWALYEENLSDENIRKERLINALLNSKNYKAMICVEDGSLYNNKTDLSKQIDVPVTKINYWLSKNNKFEHNNKTYIYLKDY